MQVVSAVVAIVGTMVGCSLVMGEVPAKERAGLTNHDAGDSGVRDSGRWDTSTEHDARADVTVDADAADAAEAAVQDATPDSDAGPCDGAAERVFYRDNDGDGHGLWFTAISACEPPTGTWVTKGDDCHDENADVFPGQTRHFAEHFFSPDGAYSFDYDCNGQETGGPNQFYAPSVCEGLLCGTKGFVQTPPRPREPAGANRYCGSNVMGECQLVGCAAVQYTVMQRFVCN